MNLMHHRYIMLDALVASGRCGLVSPYDIACAGYPPDRAMARYRRLAMYRALDQRRVERR